MATHAKKCEDTSPGHAGCLGFFGGFWVWDLGSRVQFLGFRVWGLGVLGVGFRAEGLGWGV